MLPMRLRMDTTIMSKNGECEAQGCYKNSRNKGLCSGHYERLRKNGSANEEIPLRAVYRGSTEQRFWSKVDKTGDCWLWSGGTFNGGYGSLYEHGSGSIRAHVFSYKTFVGTIPPGMHVLHRCDNPPCVRPEHLFLGSNADNVADKVAKGRQPRGESMGSARLTSDQVIQIMQAEGPQRAIAKRFGVAQKTVSAIKTGTTWGHLFEEIA